MNTRLFALTVILCALSAVAGSQIGVAVEDAVTLGDIPKLVLDVIIGRVNGAKIEEVSKETEDGVIIFEAVWIVDGKKHAVEVAEDGVIVESSKAIASEAVPSRIRKAIEAHFPIGVKIEFEKKNVVVYEAGAEIDGEETDVLITASGQIAKEPDD